MHLILFGPPGVGKGTQAKLISEKFHIAHISTGDLLREAIAQKSELGLKAQEIMNKGQLVTDDIMIGLIKELLNAEKTKAGFILDGFPRTVIQAEELAKLFEEKSITDYKVIEITAEEDQIINRISNRRSCIKCGAVYNLMLDDIGKDCIKCNSKDSIYQRDDDKKEVFQKRLDVYKKQTFPIKEFYAKKGKLIEINGFNPINIVFEEIVKVIN